MNYIIILIQLWPNVNSIQLNQSMHNTESQAQRKKVHYRFIYLVI